ncbi:hypothetical protein [Vogesella indigofera]|uniref:hypothetical protein n=1 Tax=Vogesella indigofera TaxID=45465 RepID=UPI00234EE194|nr:hypothetical protein [Vogesella indigofera]MDC7709540.1 hypothetical protein [Vogesella indigofera]
MIRILFNSRRKRWLFVWLLLGCLLFQQIAWLWSDFSWHGLAGMALASLIYAIAMQCFFAVTFDRNAAVRVQQTLTLPLALPVARGMVLAELQARYGRRVRVQGDSHFEVRTACSFKSWGECLSVDLAEAGVAATRVHLCCQPRLRLTLIDWGKNRDNVDNLLRALAQRGKSGL